MITFHIITLFPESFSYFADSILARAVRNKRIKIVLYNLRDFTLDKRKTVDDKPYGGGPGMVLKAEPIIRAVQKIMKNKKRVKVIMFSTAGKIFTNVFARTLARRFKHIVLIAGRYEGVDERVIKILHAEKISIGPYVLTGGEIPAMATVDAIARHIGGVLGKDESLEERRVASPEVYTRPEIIFSNKKKYRVPEVLLSGDHKKIEAWRRRRRK